MAGVFNIPTRYSFLDAMAKGLLLESEGSPLSLAEHTIFLPTRRDAKVLRDAFLKLSGGSAILLPKMLPLGDLDSDEELILNAPLPQLSQVMTTFKRQGMLMQLVAKALQRSEAITQRQDSASVLELARDLMRLIDQGYMDGANWHNIDSIVPSEFAEHWQLSLEFLRIVTEHWPKILAETGMLEPHTYHSIMVDTMIERWRLRPPSGYVIGAGSMGTRKTTAKLLKAISELEKGYVLLPGFDGEFFGEDIKETHPLFAYRHLFKELEVGGDGIPDWPRLDGFSFDGNFDRGKLFLSSLGYIPEKNQELQNALSGLEMLEANSMAEEAHAIAIIIREALETQGQTINIISNNESLTDQTIQFLQAWDIPYGRPYVKLSQTLIGQFILMLLQLLESEFDAHLLLGLLKHPYMNPEYKALLPKLELDILRDLRLKPGMKAILDRVDDLEFLDGMRSFEKTLSPLIAAYESEDELDFSHILEALNQTLKVVCLPDGDEWNEGVAESFGDFLSEIGAASVFYPKIPGPELGSFMEILLKGYKSPLNMESHPRLKFLTPQEARLHHADLTILAGMNEGSWPGEARLDAWLSRGMRSELGLALPEREIGLAAHDFYQTFSAKRVIITRSVREGGTPTIPSRWLLEMEAQLKVHGLSIGRNDDYLAWAKEQYKPDRHMAIDAPAPCPPPSARPRKLSVTEVELLMRDPYSIYAKKILKLKPLRGIAEDLGAREKGILFHEAMDKLFLDNLPKGRDLIFSKLLSVGEGVFASYIHNPEVDLFWWPRFRQAASWVAQELAESQGVKTHTEIRGEFTFDSSLGGFTLVAKADRIDENRDGSLSIIDYKTGALPSMEDVDLGFAPQLPLEAAIAIKGGFGIKSQKVSSLEFWSLGLTERKYIKGDMTMRAKEALCGLENLINYYDYQDVPYHTIPRANKAQNYNDYAHLARVKEWQRV